MLRPRRGAAGHEQRGTRPAIVLQSDDVSWLSTTLVAPTSTQAQATRFRPEVVVRGRRTRVLLDQLTVVDRTRVARSSGRLSEAELREVDDALRLILGLV